MKLEKYLLILFLILLAILFFIGWKYDSSYQKEGFDDLVPIEYVMNSSGTPTSQLIPGYYKADDQFMRRIPYGYVVDPADSMHILPKSLTALTYAAGQHEYGTENIIEDGYYLTAGHRLAILPPGMYADVSGVSYIRNPSTGLHVLKYTYREGYISKDRHFLKSFAVNSEIEELPPGFYYTDSSKTRISFLPDGAMADTVQGWGYKYAPGNAPTDINPENKSLSYSDLSRNFMAYHKTEAEIKSEMEAGGATSLGGYMSMIVKDQNGNLVKMPVPDSSYGLLGVDSEVYYKPGQYPYGAQNYVPSYEDYVYLTYADGKKAPQMTMAKYADADSAKGGFCEATSHSMIEREAQCNALSGNICASTSCCVLLGGEKCVAGGADGPENKENYADLFIKNKDFYYYNTKCYGNCR